MYCPLQDFGPMGDKKKLRFLPLLKIPDFTHPIYVCASTPFYILGESQVSAYFLTANLDKLKVLSVLTLKKYIKSYSM